MCLSSEDGSENHSCWWQRFSLLGQRKASMTVSHANVITWFITHDDSLKKLITIDSVHHYVLSVERFLCTTLTKNQMFGHPPCTTFVKMQAPVDVFFHSVKNDKHFFHIVRHRKTLVIKDGDSIIAVFPCGIGVGRENVSLGVIGQ